MKRALAWAAASPVFANLLMGFLIAAGFFAVKSITREMFPEFAFDNVIVTVVYPGAAPSEIEESVTIKIEEAVRSMDGVRKVESISSEGVSTVTIEVDGSVRSPEDVLVDVRNEVSRITTFPKDVEEPNIRLIRNRREVARLVLSGKLDEGSLTRLGTELEQDLLLLPEINEVGITGLRPFEIAVLLREADLQRYGLSFSHVSQAIAGASLDLPIGKLRSSGEEQLLRVQRQRYVGKELEEVPVLTRTDGTRILLRDVARIDDGFQEDVQLVRIDGLSAVTLTVQRTSDQDTIQVADKVKAWLAETQEKLPEGVTLSLWNDGSRAVVDRLSLLTRNGMQGLALVFAALLLFLGVRLSFWVAFGLPVAFLTAIILLLGFGGSLNMITSFALIMILGILVDDSIVVAENIARHMKRDGYSVQSAIAGLHEVTWPVVASVTTTAVAFMPLFFLPGIMGKFIRIMPVAVVACLLASLIECLIILPAHLAHEKEPTRHDTKLQRFRAWIDGKVDRFVNERYGPTVDWCLRNRYVVMAASTAALILVAGLVASGRPAFLFFPRLDAQFIRAEITMPQGTPLEETLKVVRRLEASAKQLNDGLPLTFDGKPIARRLLTQAGINGAHTAQVELELSLSSDRDVKGIEIIRRWRKLAGPFPTVRSLTFGGIRHRPGGRPIEIRLTTESRTDAGPVAEALREALDTYPGVFNISDNLEPGKRELRFKLTEQADTLGVTLREMAVQLQAGFIGQEVHKIQRGRDEVQVRVRYEEDLRQRQDQLGGMRLRSSTAGQAGGAVQGLLPLEWAADIELGRGLSRVERRNGRRVVLVTADVDDSATNANDVVTSLRATTIPDLVQQYPGVKFEFGGAQEEQRDTLMSLLAGFGLALLGIYAILVLLFGSYVQPVVVMMVIPMGFAGAILGHAVVGRPLMIFSIFGMVGLTGIVVNDALVLIDFINRGRRGGLSPFAAASASGRVRFRAVFLTTVTTVLGLLPILLETSLQAQFVIPMALSISSGVAAATVLTLYVVPCIYLVVEDLRGFFHHRGDDPGADPASAVSQVVGGLL